MVLELQLQTLSLVSTILATQSGQREMLHQIMDVLEARLGFIRGTILLLTPDKKELRVEVVRQTAEKVDSEIRYSWGEGIVGRVVPQDSPPLFPRFQRAAFQRQDLPQA